MLVFGLGHDSAYWNKANSGGYTVFVEDSAEWISTIRAEHPELEGKIFQYTYKTRLAKEDQLKAPTPAPLDGAP